MPMAHHSSAGMPSAHYQLIFLEDTGFLLFKITYSQYLHTIYTNLFSILAQ